MRCQIAETFGKFPWEVGLLPFHEYRLCRNYVLAQQAPLPEKAPEDPASAETWGEQEVAEAGWDAESVTSLK